MSKYLNHNATLQCTHGGQVMMIPPPMRSLYIVESPVVTDVDLYEAMIIGCPQIGPGIKPCLKIIAILMGEAIQIEVDGETPILSSLEAMTDGVPPGMVSAITDGGSNAEPAPFSIMAMTMSAASAIGAALCPPCLGSGAGAGTAVIPAPATATTPDIADVGSAALASAAATGGPSQNAPKSIKNPCAGIGMATSEKEEAYVGAFKKLQSQWKGLSPSEREAKIKGVIEKPLVDSGAPAADVRSKPLSEGRNGEFDFQTWTLTLNQSTTTSPELTDEQARKLAGTVYHEARHSEQFYLVARKRAAEGENADAISRELGIPKTTAERAVKNPLNKSDPGSPCADAVYSSVYGKNANQRNKTLTDLPKRSAALKQAVIASQNLDKDPQATPDQKKAALENWNKTYADFNSTYNDYRSLPEEYDAWSAGDSAESIWQKPIPKLPQNGPRQ